MCVGIRLDQFLTIGRAYPCTVRSMYLFFDNIRQDTLTQKNYFKWIIDITCLLLWQGKGRFSAIVHVDFDITHSRLYLLYLVMDEMELSRRNKWASTWVKATTRTMEAWRSLDEILWNWSPFLSSINGGFEMKIWLRLKDNGPKLLSLETNEVEGSDMII